MKKKWIIVLAVIGSIVLVAGVCSYTCVKYITSSVDKMQIVLEDLNTGNLVQLTGKGMNVTPRFSHDGSKVFFISKDTEDENSHRVLKSYDIKTKKLTSYEISGYNLTSSVNAAYRLLCYSDDDIYSYMLKNSSAVRITTDGKKKTGAVFSPDGKWIAFLEEIGSTNNNIIVIRADGTRMTRLTDIDGMLSKIQAFTWMKDSRHIAYISFLDLIIRKTDGAMVNKINLAGLSNFKSLMINPRNRDELFLWARDADSGISFEIFKISVKHGTYEVWKKGRGFWEMSHDISPDGRYMVYSMKVD